MGRFDDCTHEHYKNSSMIEMPKVCEIPGCDNPDHRGDSKKYLVSSKQCLNCKAVFDTVRTEYTGVRLMESDRGGWDQSFERRGRW